MKKIFIIAIASFTLISCANKKADKKALVDDIMKIHEKVMSADDRLMQNKLLLDSMVKHNSTGDIKDSVYSYLGKINRADSIMDNWMHKFDPEHTGKSEDETIGYFDIQKEQIMAIDSQLNTAVTGSNKYLIKMKMK